MKMTFRISVITPKIMKISFHFHSTDYFFIQLNPKTVTSLKIHHHSEGTVEQKVALLKVPSYFEITLGRKPTPFFSGPRNQDLCINLNYICLLSCKDLLSDLKKRVCVCTFFRPGLPVLDFLKHSLGFLREPQLDS